MNKSLMFAGILSIAFATGASGVSAQGGGGGGYGGGRPAPEPSAGGYGDYGPGSGTGRGRDFGPGSGTGMGRCRPVRVQVCRGGAGDGRGPRCRIEEQL